MSLIFSPPLPLLASLLLLLRSQGAMNFQRNGMGGFNNGYGGMAGRGGGFPGGGMTQDGQRPHNYRTKACRYFQMGSCKNGDRCNFIHTMDGAAGNGGGGGMGGGMMNGGQQFGQQQFGGGMQQQRW